MIKFPAMLVACYLAAMPFLVGLPRGSVLPMLRPSEGLQLAVTGAGAALVGLAVLNGQRWHLRLRSIEWWLLAMTTAAGVVPVLWLLARGRPVGGEELLAAFPFIKYAVLYLLVRLCVRSEADVLLAVRALLGSAVLIAAIAAAQALGVGPVIDVLGRFFVSSVEDVVDGGRGTTTIGSSIATGAYLTIATGVALSVGLATGNRLMLATAAVLASGTLASGQAGSVLALGLMVAVVAHLNGRSRQLLLWGVPAGFVALFALWPIVAARLSDIDQGSGLPASWIIRWNNISELYLPSLFGRGWILGVSPNAIVQPPDVWREAVYLESGYLWLLWVGGLPLLLTALGFLRAAWRGLAVDRRDPGPVTGLVPAVRVAGQAAVAMIAVLSIIDPHLTLRAGADAFFIVVALGLSGHRLAVPVVASPVRWRSLLAAEVSMAHRGGARLQLAEGPTVADAELTLDLLVREDGVTTGSTRLALFRRGADLHGVILPRPSAITATAGADTPSDGLLWRGLVTIADSLRLAELQWPQSEPHTGPTSADRAELKLGADLAEKLEIERMAHGHRFNRLSTTPAGSDSTDDRPLPAIRLDFGLRVPVWKRGVDIVLGTAATVATAPLWLASALLVRRSSPGPVLYRQVRIGSGGLPFQIYKFRTMFTDNDDSAHREQNTLELQGEAVAGKDSDDPRITGIGRWLRRLSLDELPQLINVLRSEMSLVGPRPSLLWESEMFQPASRRRLTARPGLTGLWQVSGRADVSMSEMLELDLDYVDSMGPKTDLRCLVGTVTSVLAGEGAR